MEDVDLMGLPAASPLQQLLPMVGHLGSESAACRRVLSGRGLFLNGDASAHHIASNSLKTLRPSRSLVCNRRTAQAPAIILMRNPFW